MSNTSRHRIALAAGAVLAGAAIPIAAVGTAWADVTSDTTGTSPGQTQTIGQLEHEGLSLADAKLVYDAEQPTATTKDPTGGTAVEVSVNGTVVVDANNTGSETATAVSGSTHDIAVAIGAGSSAGAGAGTDTIGYPATTPVAIGPGTEDKSFADGAGAEAFSGTGNDDTATATGAGSAAEASTGNHDIATASNGAEALAGGSWLLPSGQTVVLGSYDTATANGAESLAGAGTSSGAPGSHDTAYVKGTDDFAEAGNGDDDTAKVIGNDSTAKSGNQAISGDPNSTTGYNADHAFADGSGLTADAEDRSGQTVVVHPHAELIPLP